jgi:hypothetical protein
MIPTDEIAAVLRAAALGEIPLVLDESRSWKEIYCGNVSLRIGTWQVVVFNDCDTLDYVDAVQAPDGRTAEYDDWAATVDPFDMLTSDEARQFQTLVRAALPVLAGDSPR